jgi:hypothetical protein
VTPVTFYDPHPGLLGCLYRLPASVKVAADALDGQTLTLDEALARLREAAAGLPGLFRVVEHADAIALYEGDPRAARAGEWRAVNCWRVIRFKAAAGPQAVTS